MSISSGFEHKQRISGIKTKTDIKYTLWKAMLKELKTDKKRSYQTGIFQRYLDKAL